MQSVMNPEDAKIARGVEVQQGNETVERSRR